jgi:transcriptional regulator with XRE-family HTH domain
VAAVTSVQGRPRDADISPVMEPSQDVRSEDIGTRLRAVRELTGASTRDVAKAAGLSRRELQAAERGAKRLSPDQLHALAGALSVEPDVLVGASIEGELERAGTAPDRTDQLDPDRRLERTGNQWIEQSWREVRNEMRHAYTSCVRLVQAGPGDDVRELLERLDRDLHDLRSRPRFRHKLADHERALGTGPR